MAIGEIGLDFYRDYSPRDRQLQAFRNQLAMATRLQMPVVIHSRQAEEDTLAILGDWITRHNVPPGVIHCFMGNGTTAERYLEMGFVLLLAGYISYPRPVVAPDVIRAIPSDRLLVETDCPFLTPQSRRGQRNEPAYITETVAALAGIRGVPVETLSRETTENARRVFGW